MIVLIFAGKEHIRNLFAEHGVQRREQIAAAGRGENTLFIPDERKLDLGVRKRGLRYNVRGKIALGNLFRYDTKLSLFL